MTATIYRLADYRPQRRVDPVCAGTWLGLIAGTLAFWALLFISAARALL